MPKEPLIGNGAVFTVIYEKGFMIQNGAEKTRDD